MVGIYRYFNQNAVLFLLLFSMLAVILQTFYISGILGRKLRKSFEALILIYLGALSILIRHINMELSRSVLVLDGKEYVFFLLAILIFGAGIYTYVRTKRWNVILGMVLTILNMPAMQRLVGSYYAFFFVVTLVLLTTRAGISYYIELKRQKTSITEYSIKEALDAQHSGILFAEKNGNILLINKKMLSLMSELSGGYIRNSEKFWEGLADFSEPIYQGAERENILVETRTQGVWQFARRKCVPGRWAIYQIIATDVTEQENINRQLREYQERLEAQKSQLEQALGNLEELKKQEALGRMWNHVHDVLGQRISILQRELGNKEAVNFELLENQIEHLLTDLNFVEEEDPFRMYQDIVDSFLPLGIRLHTQGRLPEDKLLARKLVEIIREAVTNAVRHGRAENIYIQIEDEESLHLMIENDGDVPMKEIQWGGGLRSIRQKVEEAAGKLEVQAEPQFKLYAEFPTNVKKDRLH